MSKRSVAYISRRARTGGMTLALLLFCGGVCGSVWGRVWGGFAQSAGTFQVGLPPISGTILATTAAPPKGPPPGRVAELAPDDEPTNEKIKPWPLPDLSPAVQMLLDADYLKDDERADLRIQHGAWEEADLASLKRRAAAAIIRGDYADTSLTDESAAVEDRAEGAIRRGEPSGAISLLTSPASYRAKRVLAEALLDSGKVDEARAILLAAANAAGGGDAATAPSTGDELAEAVRCALLLSRWQAPTAPGTIAHQQMLTLLAKARDELDRISWRANLVEAMLLYERDRFEDVSQAVESTLALNPRCAEAYYIYGEMCIDTFDFPRGERIAARLDELASPSPSPLGAALRAYIRLRQNEGEQAFEQIEPAFKVYPASRQLLAFRAAAAAVSFDFPRTDGMLKEFDALSPNSPFAYFIVGRAMSGSRQYDEAATYLNVAVSRAPNWAEPVVELGLSEFQAGRNDAALLALEQAKRLDPQNHRASNSLMLLHELANYTSVESDHFIVRCQKGVDEVVATEMLAPLEGIYERVTGNGPGGIDHKPNHKTVVELYSNHRLFGVRITGMPALHTIAAATGPVIAMESPREGPGHMGAFDWRRVVQHEYTHTVTLSRTKNRLPHWFTEASAVYLEDSPRDYTTIQLLTMAYENGGLFDMDTINIMFVRPRRPTDRSLAYAQGHMMYEFIMDHFGPLKPLELMDLYATGVRENAAFQKILGVTREEFLAAFKDWMKAKLQVWGMLETDESPEIKTLLARAAKEAALIEPRDAIKPDEAKPKDAKPDDAKPAAPDEDEKPLHVPDVIVPPAPPTPPAPGDDEPPTRHGKSRPATKEQLLAWREKFPRDPFVLSALIKEQLKDTKNEATAEMVPLLNDYAAARTVDPLPHKLLAAYYLKQNDGASAIAHLEYLDAREQLSPGYAVELSRQYAAVGDMQRAMAKAARATQIAPYEASYREYAAGLAIRAKDFAVAERHIKALIALEPDREVHKQRLEALQRLRATSAK